jgi:acyl carrier protein
VRPLFRFEARDVETSRSDFASLGEKKAMNSKTNALLVLAGQALLLLPMLACTTQTHSRPPVRSARVQGSTLDQVCRITSDLMQVEPSQVTATTSLGELGADEADFVHIVFELEDHFDISIPDEAADRVLGTDDWQAGVKNVTMAELAAVVDERTR